MLWEDFVKQSKVDLRRSCLLFAEGDYGASAYSCQQALEKYLKAYLMKHNLLNNNPSEIGHMKMSKLLRIITVRTESVVQKFSREGELKIIPLLQARQELRHLENSLKRLQPPSGSEDSELLEFKLELWKRSLQMPIKVKYEKELEEIKAQVHDRLWPIAEKIVQYHQEEVRPIYEKFSDAQKRAVAEKYFQDWGFHNEVITEIIRGNIPSMELDKLYLYYIALCGYLEYLLRIRKNARGANFFRATKELFMLTYPFRFIETIIATYPHEDIGRYPTEIEDMSTTELYAQGAEHLANLIVNVRHDCSKIEHAIHSRWNDA